LVGIVQHSNEKVEKYYNGNDSIYAQDCLSCDLGEFIIEKQLELLQVNMPQNCPEQHLHSLKQTFNKNVTN
jgi:hypothetical protein